jgi:hypothetical protein
MNVLIQYVRCELGSVPDDNAEEVEVMCRTSHQMSVSRWAVSDR